MIFPQVVAIFAGVRGLMDDIPVADAKKFELGLLNFIEEKYANLFEAINKDKKVTDETEAALKSAIAEYKGLFSA